MKGRLNIFQRTMLRWNDLHPYNAVHVLHLKTLFDEERLRRTIHATLEAHDLTRLTLNRDRGSYHYHAGPADCPIQIIKADTSSADFLEAEIGRQLNRGFSLGDRLHPFRFFVLPAKDSFRLGLAYLHAMVGADSVVLLMQDLANAYLGRTERRLCRPVALYPDSYGKWLRRHPVLLVKKLASMCSLARDMRRSCRPPCRDAQDMSNHFTFFYLTSEHLHRLIAAGRSWGVTLNDLFLAMLMKSLSTLLKGRTVARRHRCISIGCIVNIRKDLDMDSRRNFGLFLGSFVVTHQVRDEMTLKSLAQVIRDRTRRIKQARLYMGTPLELALAAFATSFLSTERKRKFYQKHYPLWGGITNMNLNTLWPTSEVDLPIDYLRAVSTGPVTPLVLSITTVGEKVNIGLSYRPVVYSAANIAQVKNEFLSTLTQLDDRP